MLLPRSVLISRNSTALSDGEFVDVMFATSFSTYVMVTVVGSFFEWFGLHYGKSDVYHRIMPALLALLFLDGGLSIVSYIVLFTEVKDKASLFLIAVTTLLEMVIPPFVNIALYLRLLSISPFPGRGGASRSAMKGKRAWFKTIHWVLWALLAINVVLALPVTIAQEYLAFAFFPDQDSIYNSIRPRLAVLYLSLNAVTGATVAATLLSTLVILRREARAADPSAPASSTASSSTSGGGSPRFAGLSFGSGNGAGTMSSLRSVPPAAAARQGPKVLKWGEARGAGNYTVNWLCWKVIIGCGVLVFWGLLFPVVNATSSLSLHTPATLSTVFCTAALRLTLDILRELKDGAVFKPVSPPAPTPTSRKHHHRSTTTSSGASRRGTHGHHQQPTHDGQPEDDFVAEEGTHHLGGGISMSVLPRSPPLAATASPSLGTPKRRRPTRNGSSGAGDASPAQHGWELKQIVPPPSGDEDRDGDDEADDETGMSPMSVRAGPTEQQILAASAYGLREDEARAEWEEEEAGNLSTNLTAGILTPAAILGGMGSPGAGNLGRVADGAAEPSVAGSESSSSSPRKRPSDPPSFRKRPSDPPPARKRPSDPPPVHANHPASLDPLASSSSTLSTVDLGGASSSTFASDVDLLPVGTTSPTSPTPRTRLPAMPIVTPQYRPPPSTWRTNANPGKSSKGSYGEGSGVPKGKAVGWYAGPYGGQPTTNHSMSAVSNATSQSSMSSFERPEATRPQLYLPRHSHFATKQSGAGGGGSASSGTKDKRPTKRPSLYLRDNVPLTDSLIQTSTTLSSSSTDVVGMTESASTPVSPDPVPGFAALAHRSGSPMGEAAVPPGPVDDLLAFGAPPPPSVMVSSADDGDPFRIATEGGRELPSARDLVEADGGKEKKGTENPFL
ncbi:hypothetical protein HDU96_002561 [Phlyctochytrium bullatum]|nr:hypothetical protein HDU96_002561 [Phlyctochytrium bullatum]